MKFGSGLLYGCRRTRRTRNRTFSVAQIWNLLYRRIAFGNASKWPRRLGNINAQQIENLRYGRVQLCATVALGPSANSQAGMPAPRALDELFAQERDLQVASVGALVALWMIPELAEVRELKRHECRAPIRVRAARIFGGFSWAVAMILLVLGAAHNAVASPNPEEVFGIAHVDGKYFLTKEDFLDEGADQVLATGSKVIKIYLAPKRYPWNSDWPKGVKSMLELAQTPYYKSVFAKAFHTYIITAYSVGRGDNYWTDGITSEQATDEARQFYELTKYLLTTYKGTGKTFVLQHWEGDWAMRRGAPKPYDADYNPTETAVKGMIAWLNARQAGIVKARKEVSDTDVHVYGATEANRVEDSMAGRPGVANSVLPYTTVDLASYSCYNFLDTPERLARAVDYIAAHLPPTAVFGRNAHSVYLGEFGYPENGPEGDDGLNRRMDNAISVVNSKGLPWAAFWDVYCNEPKDKTLPLPLNGKENDQNLRGYWMVKPDGSPSLAWHRYRRLFVMADAERATTACVESGLKEVLSEDFNRPDGTNLGTGWTEAAHYGVVNRELVNHRMRFSIPDGHDIPWGSATLDLKNDAVLGHGLEVGDYFEITLRRLSERGGLGVELFDSDQLRVGSDLNAGPSGMKAWNGITWVPVAFDDHGRAVEFDWNTAHRLGVRFDSADGHHATFSYYLDGRYAGSWLVATTNRILDKIGVYAQSRMGGAEFEFWGLEVYGRAGALGVR